MKKAHLALLIVTAILALFSAYSLAAINQTYEIKFEWYSKYQNKYVNEHRETIKDKWLLQDYPEQMKMGVVSGLRDFTATFQDHGISETEFQKGDFGRYILLFLTLKEVNSPEYRAKIINIAQRGGVVEIMVSLNSPSRISDIKEPSIKYTVYDIVRIDRSAFSSKGKLLFVFKDQDGSELEETYCEVK